MDGRETTAHGRGVGDLGRVLVVFGAIAVVVGLGMMLLPRVPWLGRLPGDIHVQRETFSVHFPIVTCLVVSAVLTLVANLLFRR